MNDHELLDGLCKKSDVAKALHVSQRCVEHWMMQRKLPFIRISARCVRFHMPSVMKALDRLTIQEVK